MNMRSILTITCAVLLISAPVKSAPVPDRLIGTLILQNPEKLDAKAKKELAVIAAKINKSRQKGTVKLKGDIPSAESEGEYILKAAFMARNVAAHIKPLLAARYQVFITASKYSGEKRTGRNSVVITLYPHELKAEVGGFTSTHVTSNNVPTDRESFHAPPAQPVYQQPAQSGLLSHPPDDDSPVEVTSKKERAKKETENPALANELVIKAKARAAEKAKRLERGE